MLPFRFSIPKFLFGGETRSIDLPSVQIHHLETGTDRRTRTLKHLIKANHANFSVLYHNLQFDNHMPHILGSAYFFNATPEHLNSIYDAKSKQLEPWHDAPSEISKDDWRDFLGKREYQRAFIDFFEDQLVQVGYDWRELLDEYLYKGKEPLINNMICGGLAHPLIHLGYGHELSSHTVIIEALTMGACSYNSLHKYLDDPSYTNHPPSPSSSVAPPSPLDLLQKIHKDSRFDNLFSTPGASNVATLFDQREAEVLEYWNAWSLSKPKQQFQASQQAAVALLVGCRVPNKLFDFFLVHLLTSSHAVRILLPLIPARFQIPLVRQWWLFAIAVYVAQLRPAIEMHRVRDVDVTGKDWGFVERMALTAEGAFDAHYVKALRAIREAGRTWGDEDGFYLKAAVGFAEGFDRWGGFGIDAAEEEEGRSVRRK